MTASVEPSGRTARVAARLLAGAVVVTALASAVTNARELAAPLLFAAWLAITAAVAALIAARRPRNAVGWVLLGATTILAVHAAASSYVSAGHERGIVAWLNEWLSIPAFALLVFVPLLFPTGAVPSPRWRAVGWVAVIATGILTVATALRPQKMGEFGPNALGWSVGGPVLEMTGLVAGVVVNLCMLAAVASLVVRMRRAEPLERQQIRWLLFGVIAMLAGGLFAAVSPPLTNELSFFVAMAGLTAVPVVIGVAILEYHLWELDRVVNRALVYTVLTLALGAVYVGTVVGLAGFLDRLAGLAASVAATVLVALLVLPARDALQRIVDRLLYGDRHEPLRALRRLGARLESAVDPSDAPRMVVSAVRSGLKLPYVALELEGSDGGRLVAAVGAPSPSVDVMPVTANGEVVGRLHVDATRPLRTHDRELLDALIAQAAPTLQAAQLAAQLRWSRERIVMAREEERRRLRGDLHDGIGSRLAGLTLGIEAAGNLVGRDPGEAAAVLADLQNMAQEAVAEVRQVVAGLRPPALDDLGLAAALRARATELSAHTPVELTAEGDLEGLPAAVEVALYRIGVEAMTNVVRHAQARRCMVTLHRTERQVTLQVDDDGRGLAAESTSGFGLTSMSERVAEVGGTCVVGASSTGGTRVSVTIPTGAP